MQKSYTRNYFWIYFLQILTFSTQFLSMFIVSPLLASVPAIYGIFAVCLQTNIFLSYADLGFMGAAFKYTSESFARNEKEQEVKVLGLATFILVIFIAIFMVVILALSFFPQILIRELTDAGEIVTASQLLLILALFSPTTILARMCNIIFGIRLEDYIYSTINFFLNLVKIACIYLFVTSSKYDIVGYFLFIQIVTLFGVIIPLFIAWWRYHYNFKLLIKSIKYSKETFNLMKSLAFNSLYTSIMWIIYYEIDLLVIGPLVGAQAAAYYNIALSVMVYFRSIFNLLSSPFPARYNHFIGVEDTKGLKAFFSKTILFLTPLIILPVFTITIFMKPFIFAWVGDNYFPSVIIGQLFALCWIFHFIALPASNLLFALKRTKEIYLIATLNTIVYWGGIAILFPFLGLISFAWAKLATFVISGMFYIYISQKFTNSNSWSFMKHYIVPIIIPLCIMSIGSYFIFPVLGLEKGWWNLLMVLSACGGIVGLGLVMFFGINKEFRTLALNVINELFPFISRILAYFKIK